MHPFGEFALKATNRIIRKLKPQNNFYVTNELSEYSGQSVSDLIEQELSHQQPSMVCRIGMVEFYCLLTHYFITEDKPIARKAISYLMGTTFPFWWDSAIFREMSKNAGFINPSAAGLTRFCELMLDDMQYIDILGSWMKGEQLFSSHMPNAKKVSIWDLEPYKHSQPWSKALEGKTVLVVHPFERSIQSQYLKREVLFQDQRVLPKFKLKTIQAVQSIAYSTTKFVDWFDALNYMKDQISSTDFDIAIIGCGAYGLPLAAHVKRLGKKGIHLGGATQILFGIKGARWEKDNYYVQNIFNHNWVKPLPEETPRKSTIIEDNCYW